MDIVLIIVIVLMVAGCFFALTAGVGMLRMPDFYTRLHPAGKADTAAQGFILAALIVMAFHGPPEKERYAPTEAQLRAQQAEESGAVHGDHAEHADHADHAGQAEHAADGHDGDAHGTNFGSQAPDIATAIKLFLIIAFLVITAPTATHAICKAAWLGKLQPWMNDEARANEAKANAESLDTLSNYWVSTTGIRRKMDLLDAESTTSDDGDNKGDS